jgi:hypothetical protein
MSGLYRFHLNGRPFEVTQPILRGIEIRALTGIGPDEDLVLERQGSAPDELLRDETPVSLDEGPVHLFTKPPTMFGAS